MHSFPSFVVRDQHWSIFRSIWVNERLDPVSYRIEGVEYIEESRTRWQCKVLSQHIDASNCHEHTNRATKGEKGTWVKM